MLSVARCVHRVPGRVRFRILERRGDTEYFSKLRDTLERHDGVNTVEVNPITASILIHHTGSADAIATAARASGLFQVLPVANSTVGAQAAAGLRDADRGLRLVTNGKMDVNSALFLGLTGFAIHQALEGNIVAPASTLLWYALTALKWDETKL
jgi:hypothetical protein